MSSLFAQWLATLDTANQENSPPASPVFGTALVGVPVELDPVLEAAVPTAQAAIAEVVSGAVIGDHLGAYAESHYSATHMFECLDPAYRGWFWVAVLARVPGEDSPITVSETALLPGTSALLAPAWVPWRDRIQPGDLGVRDTLPKKTDDPNLEQGFEQVATGDYDDVDQVAQFELGLGRKRVLSPQGIRNAAKRWFESETGPDGDFARNAKAHCSSCGYLLPMAGSVRAQFGICANEWSPFDGRVVALESGCGAHSETDVKQNLASSAEAVIDDHQEKFDVVALGQESHHSA